MIRDAHISECGRYRYRLFRQWDRIGEQVGAVLWIMLNPSTADASIDDATIRRCIAFSRSWGYSAMWVGNLYAYRSTEPDRIRDMGAGQACRGMDNEYHLREMAELCELVVCAWGSSINHLPETMIQVPRTKAIRCLGTTQNGSPKHPLYLPQRTPLQDYTP